LSAFLQVQLTFCSLITIENLLKKILIGFSSVLENQIFTKFYNLSFKDKIIDKTTQRLNLC